MHPAYNYIKQAINGQYPDTEASAIAKAILIDVFQLSTTDLYASKDMNFSTNQAEKLEVLSLDSERTSLCSTYWVTVISAD